jgi:hypothetical protein
MPFKANTFEGGADGVAITTANSGDVSGTPFDLITLGTDAIAEFDTARAAQGAVSGRLASLATAASVQLRWTFDEVSELFTRFYLYLPSTTPLPARLMFIQNQAASLVGRCQINDQGAGPRLQVHKEADAANAIGTVPVTRDAWIRIETWLKLGSAGVIQAKLFNSPDISTADEVVTLDPAATTNLTASHVRFGWNIAVANSEYWLDALAMETSGYMGPYSEPQEGSSRRVIIA